VSDPDLARVVRDLRLYAEDPEWSDIVFRDDVGTLLASYDARGKRIAELERIEAAVRDLFEVMPMKARCYLAEHCGEVNRVWLALDATLREGTNDVV
jgi:hypothetical protein